MPVSYLVGSSVVCLIRGTGFWLVFGSKLFIDCSQQALRTAALLRALRRERIQQT